MNNDAQATSMPDDDETKFAEVPADFPRPIHTFRCGDGEHTASPILPRSDRKH